jgi:hypothetical protein
LEESNQRRPIFRGSREQIEIIDGDRTLSLADIQQETHLKFEAHPKWKGHVERP